MRDDDRRSAPASSAATYPRQRRPRRRPLQPALRRSGAATTLAVGACAVALAACGSTSQGKGGTTGTAKTSSVVGTQLTLSETAAPTTLDPDKTNQADEYFESPAYEPLIVRQTSGPLYAPGLATSWRYVGTGNRKFVLNLRKGVEFSDGEPLTAAAVVNSLKYVVSAGGQEAPQFTGDTFTATGPLQVTITTKTPNPDLVFDLTQDYNAGDIISPAGLKAPSKLGTQTFGAGPYELSTKQTVSGSQYVYVPNPHYYDKAAVHWKKVVVRVIPTAQSTLNAMTTGEVNLTQGDPTTMAAAKTDGVTITGAPLLWLGVTLSDRGGQLVKALGSVKVRQALNYATNRAAIAKALYKGSGQPTEQVTVPGGYGYEASLDQAYPYSVAKAKALLAAAGYPHGFTMKIVTSDLDDVNLMAEALQQQWKAIGVNLQVTDDANLNKYEAGAFSRSYPAFMTTFGQLPIATEGPQLFLPSALFNPFHTSDPTLTKLYAEDLVSSGAQKTALDQQIEAFLVHQAWFVPVVDTGLTYYAKGVAGTQVTAQDPIVNLYQVTPAAS